MAEMLERARQAAQSARRIGVVEVLGEQAGWLALQAGMAVCADAVLIPEIRMNLPKVAAKLREKAKAGRAFGLVWWRGREAVDRSEWPSKDLRFTIESRTLPGATGDLSSHVIERSGQVAAQVALEIQRLTDQVTTRSSLASWPKAEHRLSSIVNWGWATAPAQCAP